MLNPSHQPVIKTARALLFMAAAFLFFIAAMPPGKVTGVKTKVPPKIQAAILLDVSNSMDGLIEQAKGQLWNMVSVMGKAQCNGETPKIEIALYEYGRSSNDLKDGYVKQIDAFTGDLDGLSQHLFSLTTNGGDEYCGHVLYQSLTQLEWDTSAASYKVIFIAGNEDFLQGNLSYIKACAEAKKKGVLVNTIYCGSKTKGIEEHWNLGGECGNGSYTNINKDAKLEEIPTPYDSTLLVLNEKLNKTYIAYGDNGMSYYRRQSAMDKATVTTNKTVAARRVSVKGKKELYNNAGWDLVDAAVTDSSVITNVKRETLADSLQNKSSSELKKIVKEKSAERSSIQKEIAAVNAKREQFITAEKAKATGSNTATLETEIERIIRLQAKQFNMTIR